MKTENYNWKDNPTVSGISPCDTDTLNDCLMHLKYENRPNLYPKGTINSTSTGKLLSFTDNIATVSANTRTLATGEARTMEETSFIVEQNKYKSVLPLNMKSNSQDGFVLSSVPLTTSGGCFYLTQDPITKDTLNYFGTNANQNIITLNIDLPEGKSTSVYTMTARRDGTYWSQAPKSFVLKGSNDKISWETIDRQSELVWAMGETKIFNLQNEANFKYFMFENMTAQTGSYANAFGIIGLRLCKKDSIGDMFIDETQLIGIDGNNQPFATDSIYTQGNFFPKNPVEGQYHLINDPTKFGMWRYIEEAWTQENGVSDIVFCGEVLLKNGFIDEVKEFPLNSNGYELHSVAPISPADVVSFVMPDYKAGVSVPGNTLTQAPFDIYFVWRWTSFHVNRYLQISEKRNSAPIVSFIMYANPDGNGQLNYFVPKGYWFITTNAEGGTYYPMKGGNND